MECDRYRAFCEQVTRAARRATRREKQDLTRELMAHMEDHADALMEAGWTEEAARQHAVEAMGDPMAIGRAYSAQLSVFWLVCAWGGYLLRLLLVVQMILPVLLMVGGMVQRRQAMKDPLGYCSSMVETEAVVYAQDMDMEIHASEHTIRVARVQILPEEETGRYKAQVLVCFYTDSMLRSVADRFARSIHVEGGHNTSTGISNGVGRKSIDVYVEPGVDELRLLYESDGQEYRVAIPLEWEVAS